MNGVSTRRWRCAIDFHAHVMIPEMYAVTRAHSMFAKSNAAPGLTEEGKKGLIEREKQLIDSMSDVTDRIGQMDRMGIDVQVLSSSLVHQCTYWAEPQESLKLERKLNEHVARIVQSNPRRFIGLGGVPLHAPDLAVSELTRCVTELQLAGVGISTTAGDLELGDKKLRKFWEAAERLGAVVYIHPAGNHSPRFQKWHLWNSVGQTFEEAMAIASLFYEGVMDAFPDLKICISHGGGYMPYNMGRVTRNYLEKPTTSVNMRKSPAEYLRMFYYDTCVYETEVLEALVKRVGAEKIVLGSDYPVGEQKPIEFIDSASLSQDDKNKIIGLNAATLFGLTGP